MPGRSVRASQSRPRTARRAPSEDSFSSRSPSPRRHRNNNRGPPTRRYSSHRRRSPSRDSIIAPLPSEEKPFYKKKTLWATLASAATVIAILPTWRSANASKSSASASHRSADASQRSADASTRSARAVEKSLEYSERSANAAMRSAEASLRSARAVERSTKAVEKSAMAVTNTAVAGGHMDHDGRYFGPPPGVGPSGVVGKQKKLEEAPPPPPSPAQVEKVKSEIVERARSGRRDDRSRNSRGRDDVGRGRMKQIEYEPLSQFLDTTGVLARMPVPVPIRA